MDLWSTPLPAGIDEKKLAEMMRTIMNYDLSQHESISPSDHTVSGGHTIDRHVSKTLTQVIARFSDPNFTGNQNGSFYHDKVFAEALIVKAIFSKLEEVYKWFYSEAGSLARLPITWKNNFNTGFCCERGDLPNPPQVAVDQIFVLLKREPSRVNGLTSYILTAYPAR